MAIDVVVREDDSVVGRLLGIASRDGQLLALAAITALVWVLESVTELLAQRHWRTLSQELQLDLRVDAYKKVQDLEAAIQRSLLRVSRDRTTIVIAHRLSTIRHADRIHVLDGGVVAEAGTHDELVAAGGRYARLWAVQTGEVAMEALR